MMGNRLLTLEEIQKCETAMLDVTHKICKENGIKYTLICGSVLGAVRHSGPIPWDSDVDITIAYDDYEKLCEVLEKNLPDWCMLYSYKNTIDYHRIFPRIGIKGIDSAILHVDIFPQVGLPDAYEEQVKYAKKTVFLSKLYYYKSVSNATKLYKSNNKLKNFAKEIMKVILKIGFIPLSADRIRGWLDKHFSTYSFKDAKFVMNPAGHYGLKNILDKSYFTDLIEADYDSIKLNIPREYDEYLKHYYKDYHKIPSKESQEKSKNVKVYADENLDIKQYFIS